MHTIVRPVSKHFSTLASEAKDAPHAYYTFCGEPISQENINSITSIQKTVKTTSTYAKSYNSTSYRSSIWIPHVQRILKKNGLPEDLAYVPVVESKFRNDSSQRGAAGFWQLMPGTARENGLAVNDSIDERLDATKSTIAACKYLKKLRKRLPNWGLVMAAYNSGLRNVQRKREHDKVFHDDFFSHHWNKETTDYIHRLYATKVLLENKRKYGIKDYSDQLYAFN